VVFAGLLAIELLIAVLGSALKGIDTEGAGYEPGFGTPEQIGELLLTRFLFPFEAASFLLLIAAVGAVTLARRRGGIEGEESDRLLRALDTTRPRPLGTGTMAEAAGILGPTAGAEGQPDEDRAPAGTGTRTPPPGW
jgi:NADH-quinone oxidoreductase subunit J